MMARMATNDMDGTCPCCREPLPDVPLLITCMLNTDCCAACVARCMAADKCGLIDDPAFWETLGTLLSNTGKQRIIPKQHFDL